jgi:DTW domain-containing protein YfiP
MDIMTYKQKQAEAQSQILKNRRIPCPRCLQPDFSCYCELVHPFDPQIKFVILIHPIEIARRIATGRMAHLCLKNSQIISGHDFTHNKSVNAIVQNPELQCVILYPGQNSLNLSPMTQIEREALKPKNKKLTIFVIDGTWNTARKTVHLSQNLKQLPRICFTPSKPSGFRVRKQPHPNCYSTIEAIHETLDLLNPETHQQDHLLYVFNKMVARQIELSHSNHWSPWSAL